MIKSYSPGRQIVLVRNPNWSKSVDGVRPAYANKIVWNAGVDPTVAAHKTLDSTNLLMADVPPNSVLQQAYEHQRKQLIVAPLGIYYASLNTQVPPFNNINLRKAVIAMANRDATRWTAAASSSQRWLRISSIRRCQASRRPAGWRGSNRTSSRIRAATSPSPAST